jgi:hypothetical protein
MDETTTKLTAVINGTQQVEEIDVDIESPASTTAYAAASSNPVSDTMGNEISTDEKQSAREARRHGERLERITKRESDNSQTNDDSKCEADSMGKEISHSDSVEEKEEEKE